MGVCDDLISRQAAIKAVGSMLRRKYGLGGDLAEITLKEVPTADVPDRKVGKWIEEAGMLMCSECGDAWGTEQFDEAMSFNFCPNCGARLEAENG